MSIMTLWTGLMLKSCWRRRAKQRLLRTTSGIISEAVATEDLIDTIFPLTAPPLFILEGAELAREPENTLEIKNDIGIVPHGTLKIRHRNLYQEEDVWGVLEGQRDMKSRVYFSFTRPGIIVTSGSHADMVNRQEEIDRCIKLAVRGLPDVDGRRLVDAGYGLYWL